MEYELARCQKLTITWHTLPTGKAGSTAAPPVLHPLSRQLSGPPGAGTV